MPAPEAFPIIPITDDMIVQDEPMGSKDKFWCQLPDDMAAGGWMEFQISNFKFEI